MRHWIIGSPDSFKTWIHSETNDLCVLFGDAQQFRCGFTGNISFGKIDKKKKCCSNLLNGCIKSGRANALIVLKFLTCHFFYN